MWEDTANIGGGRFYLNLKKSPITNKIWEDLLISFILTNKQHFKLNGVVLNVRTHEVIISVWTRGLTDLEKAELKKWVYNSLEISNE